MDELDGRRGSVDDGGIGSDRFACGVGEERPYALATVHHGVAHRRDQLRGAGALARQCGLEHLLDSPLAFIAPDGER